VPYKRHDVCTETSGAGIATEQSNNIIYLIIYLGIIVTLCVFDRFCAMGLMMRGFAGKDLSRALIGESRTK
jgi:hypothetical protein